VNDPRLDLLFAMPAYWPATAFGGPVPVALALTTGLAARGHHVEVVTTSLLDIERGTTRRTERRLVEGVPVTYLATPWRYRWMGITPSLPGWLARRRRPDLVHVYGFRDVVTTLVAAWCVLRRIPYVFEPLGMFEPRVRKVRLKRLFDRTVARHVAARAAAVTVVSEHEARHVEAGGVPRTRIHVRGNPFPKPAAVSPNGSLRRLLGVDDAPIVLYVGRIAHGKGIELLLEALAEIPDAHLALVGPDDGHGMMTTVLAASSAPATAGRVHALGAVDDTLPLYADADVFVLPSEGESFGLVAAEAAAAGTPVVVTDRCGVAEFLGENGALVVPFERIALAAAIRRALDDGELRGRLRAGGRAAAERWSPDAVVARQEEIYRRALAP